MLDQLLLIVKGVLEAEKDAADDADDDHHADDDERGRHNQDQQSQVVISKKEAVYKSLKSPNSSPFI